MKVVCIAGKNNIAVDFLNFLKSNYADYHYVACINKTDNGLNSWQKSFKKFCNNSNIPIVTLESLYNIRDLIFISLEYDRLINIDLFVSKELYNIHFSLLPEYKGMFTSVFPILDGKNYSGVTLHKINNGIDTGEIISQKRIELNKNITARDLYLLYIKNGLALIKENAENLLNNNIVSKQQQSNNSTYNSKKSLKFNDLYLDTNATAWQIDNQVRAFSFREYQLPKFQDTSIYNSEILEEVSVKKPGTVIESNDCCFIISSIDFNVKLYKDRLDELFFYAKNDNLTNIQEIEKSGFDIHIKNQDGWDVSIISAYNNSMNVLSYLLDNGINVNNTNYKGTSLLMYAMTYASKSDDLTCMKFLIKKGASLKHKDDNGKNIFDYAIEYNNNHVLEYLNKL